MVDRTTAMRRLIESYLRTLTANPDYFLQVSMADVLDEANIEAAQKLDLYAELDRPRLREALADFHRDQQMIAAWLASRASGRAQ
jgi:hypothetical protein